MDKGPEQTLLQGGYREDLETYDRMLSITIHEKEQIKTKRRYPFTPVRMTTIYSQRTTNAGELVVKKGTLVHCWWECRLVQPLWKTVWNFLRKPKLELGFDPEISLLGLFPKNPETPIQKTCALQCA